MFVLYEKANLKMKLWDCIFFFGIFIVPFFFIIFQKIFFNKKLVIRFYIFAFALALVAWIIHMNTGTTKTHYYLYLLCPIYALIILNTGLYIFKKLYKRNPRQFDRNWYVHEDGFWQDRIFYIIYFTLTLLVPLSSDLFL